MTTDPSFYMIVADVFSILDRDIVVTGKIQTGVLKVGDEVVIQGRNGEKTTTITRIESFNKVLNQAKPGETVGISLKDVPRYYVQHGDEILSPKSDFLMKKETKETYEIIACSLEEARNKAKGKIPQGYKVISEIVLSDGQPVTIKEVENPERALATAKSKVPAGASIVAVKEIQPQELLVIRLSAENDDSARKQAETEMDEASVIISVLLALPGKKGFLGIGRTQNKYDIKILKQAVMEVTYKTDAKINITVSDEKDILLNMLGDITTELGIGRLRGLQAFPFLREISCKMDFYVSAWGDVTYEVSPRASRILSDYGINPHVFVEYKRKRQTCPECGPSSCLCLIGFSILADVFSHDPSLERIVSVLRYATKDWDFDTGYRSLASKLLKASKHPKARSFYSVDPDKELVEYDWL